MSYGVCSMMCAVCSGVFMLFGVLCEVHCVWFVVCNGLCVVCGEFCVL